MDADKLCALALNVSSTDLVTSREAARDIKAALTPASLLGAWRDPAQRQAMEQLLAEICAVGNTDVYAVVGGCLEAALTDVEVGAALLRADVSGAIPVFVLGSLGGEALGPAACARPAALALLRLASSEPELACRVGAAVDDTLDAERSLRLFDCDAVESEENVLVYGFLKAHTSRLAAVTVATLTAFDTDPLLLANYLVVSGVVSQHERPPAALVARVESVLDAHADNLAVTFVCRFCSIALFHKEDNAVAHAQQWVRAALQPSLLDGCGEDTVDAVLDLAGSASTTQAGWRAVVAELPLGWLAGRLACRSPVLQLSALRCLAVLLRSPYFDVAALDLVPALKDAWQLRSSLEEPVRTAVWDVARAVVASHPLRDQLAVSYAAFLCGVVSEESVAVRSLQLQVANILRTHAALPDATKDALQAYSSRGLYPAGSAGVAAMTKD